MGSMVLTLSACLATCALASEMTEFTSARKFTCKSPNLTVARVRLTQKAKVAIHDVCIHDQLLLCTRMLRNDVYRQAVMVPCNQAAINVSKVRIMWFFTETWQREKIRVLHTEDIQAAELLSTALQV